MTLGAHALSYVQRELVTRDLNCGPSLLLFPCNLIIIVVRGNWNPTYTAKQLGPPSWSLTLPSQQEGGKKIRKKKLVGQDKMGRSLTNYPLSSWAK